MKRMLVFCCACLLGLCGALTGCGKAMPQKDSNTLQIVCTIFPLYDWVQQITAEVPDVTVTLLIQGGTDLHSYQPAVRDIAAIADADLLCYVGGTSDAWASEALQTTDRESTPTISLLEVAEAEEEVTVEGMQDTDHHHEHEHEHDEDEAELDEHVWLSLRRAQLACVAIRDALCTLDASHAALYQENCDTYLQKLSELDAQYETMVSQQAVRTTILVADRFPFRYLAEDYGISYSAAFPGCSAETEASFETIAFLSEQLQTQKLPCILTTESSDQTLAKTILESAGTNCPILELDSLQSVTQKQLDAGESYLSRMEYNFTILQQALTTSCS